MGSGGSSTSPACLLFQIRSASTGSKAINKTFSLLSMNSNENIRLHWGLSCCSPPICIQEPSVDTFTSLALATKVSFRKGTFSLKFNDFVSPHFFLFPNA